MMDTRITGNWCDLIICNRWPFFAFHLSVVVYGTVMHDRTHSALTRDSHVVLTFAVNGLLIFILFFVVCCWCCLVFNNLSSVSLYPRVIAGSGWFILTKIFFACCPTGTGKCASRHGAEHAEVHATEAPDPTAVNTASSTTTPRGTGAEIEALDGAWEVSQGIR